MNVSPSGQCNKTNIFFGLIEYELNSLLGASHLVDYISVHIRFDLERYLLIINIIEIVSSKNVKVNQKRCLGTSIESFTGSSASE